MYAIIFLLQGVMLWGGWLGAMERYNYDDSRRILCGNDTQRTVSIPVTRNRQEEYIKAPLERLQTACGFSLEVITTDSSKVIIDFEFKNLEKQQNHFNNGLVAMRKDKREREKNKKVIFSDVQKEDPLVLKSQVLQDGIENLTDAMRNPTPAVYKGGTMSRNQQDASLFDIELELDDTSKIVRSFQIQNLVWLAQANYIMLSDYIPNTKKITGGYKITFATKQSQQKFMATAEHLEGNLPQEKVFSGNVDEKPKDGFQQRFIRPIKLALVVGVVVVLCIMLYKRIRR